MKVEIIVDPTKPRAQSLSQRVGPAPKGTAGGIAGAA